MPKIRVKRGTTSQWDSSITPLLGGELGYDTVTKTIKIGDGTTLWNSLLPLNKVEIDEISQDAIYSALTDFIGIGTNITVEYNDAGNYIVLDTGPNVVLSADLSTAIESANEYADTAVAGLGNSLDGTYLTISDIGNINGVAPLDGNILIPDAYIPSSIARDSEIITSYNDLDDKPTLFDGDYNSLSNAPTLFSGDYDDLSNKPNIALGAVKWTANHYLLPGGENTRYLAGDIVWDGGNIFVANFDNESLPTTNTQYWSQVGPGKRLNIDGRDIPNIIWDNILNKPTLFDGNYNNLSNLPTLFSGSYNDLSEAPTLFDGDYNSLTSLPSLFSGSYDDLSELPTLFSGSYNDLSDKPSIPTDVSNLSDSTNLLTPANNTSLTGTTSVESLNVTGNLTIGGTTTTVNAQDLVVSDPLIYIGEDNTSNVVDLGFVVSFNNGTYQHAGIVRDATDGKWKVFEGVVSEPTTVVDFTSATYGIVKAGTFEGSLTGNASTVTDGVYTTGSYSDPSWLTISKSKVGLSNVDNTTDEDKYKNEYVSSTSTSLTISSSSHKFKVLEINSSNAISVNIPNDTQDSGWQVGSYVEIRQVGTGQITVTKDSAVTYNAPESQYKTRTQWSSLFIEKRAANTWLVTGDSAL